jgi:hypothetical protein
MSRWRRSRSPFCNSLTGTGWRSAPGPMTPQTIYHHICRRSAVDNSSASGCHKP